MSPVADNPAKLFPAVWFRIALLAAFVVPAALFAGAAWISYGRVLDQTTAEATVTAGILREHALRVLDTDELLIGGLDQRIRQMSWDQIRADRALLTAEVHAIIVKYPQIAAVGLTDKDGVEWLGVGRRDKRQLPPGIRVRDREFWAGQQTADHGTLITTPYVSRLTGQAGFALSQRRTTPDGAFDGTIHVAVSISYFTDFWASLIRQHPGARIALVRTDGRVLAHIPPAPLDPSLPLNSPLLQHLTSGHGLTEYVARSSIDGVACICVSEKVGKYPLYLTYGIPMTAARNDWLQHLTALATICLLAALALAGTVLLAMRRAPPCVTEVAARIGSGSQGARIAGSGSIRTSVQEPDCCAAVAAGERGH